MWEAGRQGRESEKGRGGEGKRVCVCVCELFLNVCHHLHLTDAVSTKH